MNRSAPSRTPPRYHFPAFFCFRGPQPGLNPGGGGFRWYFGGLELPRVFDYESVPSLELLSARSRVLSPPAIVPDINRLDNQSLLALPCHGPLKKKEPPFTDGDFDALAINTSHLENLRAREGGVVDTTSALEVKRSQKDLVVSRSKLGNEVFRSEGPRHTPVQQGLNHLGLQHWDFQANGGGRPIIQLRTERSEACPHETGLSVDFEREVSVFVDSAT